MRITRSAGRHGIADEAIRRVLANAVRVVEIDDGLLVIGPDSSGQLLEALARIAEEGELVVFHAMALRSANAKRYLR